MVSSKPKISQFILESGRLNFAPVEELVKKMGEQNFIHFLEEPVLMGDRVIRGILSTHSGPHATASFLANDHSQDTRGLRDAPLGQVIFPFIHKNHHADPITFSVGRDSHNDFVIPDYTIAREQAIIRRTRAYRYLVQNLGTTNPTLINDTDFGSEETPLVEGDRIRLGRYEFQFLFPSALYCRLLGIELSRSIQHFINTLGKADYEALKKYALKNGEDIFVQLVKNPSLVGLGLFRGYTVDRDPDDVNATMAFLPEISHGADAQKLTILGRSIYPLVPPRGSDPRRPTIQIGRHEDNHCVMLDNSISNLHAEIVVDGRGRYRIIDKSSTNGTFVNDNPVDANGQELHEEDRITLGRFEFILLFPSSLYLRLVQQSK